MRCRHARRQLAFYRELDDPFRQDVLSHVATCPSCSAIWQEYQEQDEALAAIPVITPSAQMAVELHRQVSAIRPERRQPSTRWIAAVASIALVFGLAGAAVSWAAEAIPGDFLYPVKRASEQVRTTLTMNAAAREELQLQLIQERLDEVQQVVDLGRETRVDFRGELQLVGSDGWLVEGVTVIVGRSAWDQSPPEVGSELLIDAFAHDGRLLATSVALSPDGPPPPRPGQTPEASSQPRSRPGATATATPEQEGIPAQQSPTATTTPTRPTEEHRQHTATPQKLATPGATAQRTPFKHSSATPTGAAADHATATGRATASATTTAAVATATATTSDSATGSATATPEAHPASATPSHTPQSQPPTATPRAGDPGPGNPPTPSGPGPGPTPETPGPDAGAGPSPSAMPSATPGGHPGNNN